MSHHEVDQEKVHIGQVLTKIEELEHKLDIILDYIQSLSDKTYTGGSASSRRYKQVSSRVWRRDG